MAPRGGVAGRRARRRVALQGAALVLGGWQPRQARCGERERPLVGQRRRAPKKRQPAHRAALAQRRLGRGAARVIRQSPSDTARLCFFWSAADGQSRLILQ